MIPSLLMIRFGQNLRYWIPVPLFLLWPLLLLIWIVAALTRLFVPVWRDQCTAVLFALKVFVAARRFALEIRSDDANFSIQIW